MYKYKIKFFILFQYSWKAVCNTMLYIIHCWEQFLFQRVFIVFEAILESIYSKKFYVIEKNNKDAIQNP